MNKKNIILKSEETVPKLKVLAEKKEGVRRGLVVTAKKKERVRRELVVVAKEKESVRRKLALSAEELRLKDKKLAKVAKEKESVRRKLALTTGDLKDSYAELEKKVVQRTAQLNQTNQQLQRLSTTLEEKVRERTQDLENANIAARNVLEDLSTEKAQAEMVKVKEEAILLSIGDGLLACDEKGSIILMNKVAGRLLGWESAEAMGKHFSEVVDIEDEKGQAVSEQQRPISRVLTTGVTTSITTAGSTYYYKGKNGLRFPVAIIVTPIILGGKVIGAIDAFHDISHEKEIDKAKTEFVSLASHQLRTPLTAISWYTEMILNGDAGEVVPRQKKYLEEIYGGNKRMIGLVNTLLNVSRIETGIFKVEPEPTDIVALAKSVVDEQKPKIIEKKLAVTENLGKDVPVFSTDPKLLRMVFQNILSNAVNYTPPGGKIEFALSLDDKKTVLFKVSDTGYGIPKNQQDKIFTKLFRADNVRNKDTDGTGLGLYIVKSIVENFGGKIWFESMENKGTTFYVALPLEGTKKKEAAKGLE